MVEKLQRPPRKGPLKRTRVQTLPPTERSRTAQVLTRAAAEGRFALQRCEECETFIYPPRDACPECLYDALPLTDAPTGGKIVSVTRSHVPSDTYFRERAPWRSCLVHLDCGPVVVANLHQDCGMNDRTRMSLKLDKYGNPVLFALPVGKVPNSEDDPQLREMTAEPKFRRALISDGRGPVGQALAAELIKAGARVYVGVSNPWKPFLGQEALEASEGITTVPLDVADVRSVNDLAADIGGKIDILIHVPEHLRPGGVLDNRSTSQFVEQFEQHCLGFVNLARGFGHALRGRGADRANSAAAWVNVLSVHALTNTPPFALNNAMQAAVLSLSQDLRGQMRAGGVRVVNVFTGPVDVDWTQPLPPPKVAPAAVAKAVVEALRDGVEDVFIGDVAKDVRDRLAENPKGLERELNDPMNR